jgi:putative transposase
MPRHPRVHAEGLLYHVMARGNDGQKIFLSQSDYQALIERFGPCVSTIRFSYVLMSSHFHLLEGRAC